MSRLARVTQSQGIVAALALFVGGLVAAVVVWNFDVPRQLLAVILVVGIAVSLFAWFRLTRQSVVVSNWPGVPAAANGGPAPAQLSDIAGDGQVAAQLLFTDMDALKAAEARALMAEERLRKAIDSMQDAWLLWDADDRLEMANPAFLKTTLHPEDVSIGIHFRDFLHRRVARGWHAENKGREQDFINEVLAARRSPSGRSVEYQRMDGRSFLWRSWPTTDGGVVDVYTDITDLKRTEERALRAEMRLLDAIDATQDSWQIYDSQDRLALINQATRVNTLMPEDTPIGSKFQDILRRRIEHGFHPEAIGREEEFVREWIARRHRHEYYATEYLRPDGRWFTLREHPTREGGTVMVFVEVTEQKQWAAKLQTAREAAERANRAKSDFLSNISHELRTPLNAVLGFSQLLLFEPGGDPLTAAQNEAVVNIERTGRHLLDLVEDILDLSRIENGTIELTMETLAIPDICEQVVTLMRRSAADRGLELFVSESAARLPLVKGDRKRATQVLTNLVSNALKYGAAGRRVEITAEQGAGNEVRIAVTDFGAGIALERQAELFRPFSRVGQERTNIEGTGIGLSIAKGLVEQMGGRIGVKSAPGKGATFWFTLVTSEDQAATSTPLAPLHAEATARPLERVGPATVLYIEDTVENRTLVQRILGRYPNITYLEADSAELGIEIAKRERPAAILMDMRLPGMNGIEALKLLRADPNTAGISVIGLTGAAMPHEAAEIKAAGFDGYITKPFRIGELLGTLAAALQQRATAEADERTTRSAD